MNRAFSRPLLALGVVAVLAGIAWFAASGAARSRPPPVAQPASAKEDPATRARATSPSKPGPLAPEVAADRRKTAAEPADAGPQARGSAPVSNASDPPWAACLDRGDEERTWDCLRVHLDPHPDAAQVGWQLCHSGRDPTTSQALLLAAALGRIPADEALPWLGKVEVACPRFLGWSVLEHAVEEARARDPAWLQQFLAALTPERLFDQAAGESGLLLAAHFLEKGDLDVRGWIERGARGEWGGSAEQIERAIGLALEVDRTPGDRLAFLRSVLSSASVPGEGSLGSTFVLELLNPKTIAGGDAAGALESIAAALGDPRFKESAAATLCLRYRDDPPPGCDPAAWANLRARALEIGRAIGLVMPGEH